MGRDRTAATLPTEKYTRPKALDRPSRQLHFVDDTGRSKTFDFSGVAAAPTLIDDLLEALASGAAPGGRWQSIASVVSAEQAAKGMAQFLTTNFPAVTTLSEVGPEVWWAWRATKNHLRWPGQINIMRTLLSESAKLPDAARRAMRARETKPRARLPVNDAYSSAEFNAIRTVANRHVSQALRRIDTNSTVLRAYVSGEENFAGSVIRALGSEWTPGALLHHLSQVGMFPSQYLALCAKRQGLVDMRGVSNPAQALFPSIEELYWLMVLLVCERGFNLSVMLNLTVSSFRSSEPAAESPTHTVAVDKPRRGGERHSDEILAGEAGRLWERAVRLTQPCRDALEASGTPTDKLLIAHRHKNIRGEGPFRSEFASSQLANCHSDESAPRDAEGRPIRVTFQRLRLSEQVLSQRARQNSESVSEDIYRRPDPTTAEAAMEIVEQGQEDALAHAVATMHVRSMTAADVAAAQRDPSAAAAQLGITVTALKMLLAGELDTPTGACVDFFNSPFATQSAVPCPASFFACFACSNAILTPRHLPRLVALLDALDSIASVVSSSRWESEYAQHYARIRSAIAANTTAPEIEKARRTVALAEREMITQLVKRGLDA